LTDNVTPGGDLKRDFLSIKWYGRYPVQLLIPILISVGDDKSLWIGFKEGELLQLSIKKHIRKLNTAQIKNFSLLIDLPSTTNSALSVILNIIISILLVN
jgi:hypothetical protein